MKILNNDYIKGNFFYSIPGFVSIIFSFLSIPIFLTNTSNEIYSGYLISHFFLTFGFLLNFNIGKMTLVNLVKKKENSKEIITSSIFLTIIVATISSILIYFLLKKIITFFEINTLQSLKNINILFGLILTNLYFSIEFILKGKLYFKSLSFFNLFFFSISISGPSIFVFFNSSLNIFFISIIIKFLTIFMMLISIKNLIIKIKIKKIINFYKNIKNQAKWMSINYLLIQLYNYFDKYLIKIFFNNSLFIIYTISQQIASKLVIPLSSFNNIFIAKINNKKDQIEFAINFYMLVSIFSLFFLFVFMEKILIFWLKDNFSIYYTNIIKLFFLTCALGCFSNLMVDFYDVKKKSKKSTIYEIYLIIPFSILIFLSIYYQNIYYFVLTILFKDISLIIIRLLKINFEIKKKYYLTTSLFFLLMSIVFWLLNNQIFYITLFFQLYLFIFFQKKFFNQLLK